MEKKESISIEQLKTFCDFDGEKYVSKQGQKYIESLSLVYNLNNRNDNPFSREDIVKQPQLKDFTFDGVKEYKFICNLTARPMTIRNDVRKNEKILATDFADDDAKRLFYKALGVSYLLTCVIDSKEYIIKIGSSRTTFEKRLGSYNCGVVYNWRTASTTNIKILQSMVATRLTFRLYLCDCSNDPYYLKNWHGEDSVAFASPKALAVEDIMVKRFIKQFGHRPLANVQASATVVDED